MEKQPFSAAVPSAFILVVGALFTVPVSASGGHWAVDDAPLTEPGQCGLETWVTRFDSDNDEVVVQALCNPTGNLEFTLGAIRYQQDSSRGTAVEFGLKTAFRELSDSSWGWGLAAVTAYDASDNDWLGADIYLPVSAWLGERTLLHANLGWAYQRDDDDDMIWGVAANYFFTSVFSVIVENHGTHRGDSELRGGLRLDFDPLVIDASYGRRWSDGDDDAITLGVMFEF